MSHVDKLTQQRAIIQLFSCGKRPMKLRFPGTLSAAISEIKTKLSEARCAEIVERSDSLIRKWADPDDPALPSLRQSLLMDSAYMQAGFGEPPIQNWYINRLEVIVDDEPQEAVDIIVSTLRAQSAIGQIASSVAQYTHTNSEEGVDLSPNERASLLNLISSLSTALDEFEHSLREKTELRGPISLSNIRAKSM